MASVLLAIHDVERGRALREAIGRGGYRIVEAGALDEALRGVAEHHIDIAMLDEALDPAGRLAGELRRRQTTPRTRLVRLLDPSGPKPSAFAGWRPDATLRSEVPTETVMALLATLAPLVGSQPPT